MGLTATQQEGEKLAEEGEKAREKENVRHERVVRVCAPGLYSKRRFRVQCCFPAANGRESLSRMTIRNVLTPLEKPTCVVLSTAQLFISQMMLLSRACGNEKKMTTYNA
jgi:hypothetical protein